MAVDLSDIDQYATGPSNISTMDRLYNKMDDSQREKLLAACGLDGVHEQRQWTAIAKWLISLQLVDDKIYGDKVRRWAQAYDG